MKVNYLNFNILYSNYFTKKNNELKYRNYKINQIQRTFFIKFRKKIFQIYKKKHFTTNFFL